MKKKPAQLRKVPRGKVRSAKKGGGKKLSAAGRWVAQTEMERLENALREAQETLEAIRGGEVDAVVVSGDKGSQIYSLTSAEQPYRIYVEQMQEGAVTVSADALILFCNQKFADMVQVPLERVMGSDLRQHLAADDWKHLSRIFKAGGNTLKHETSLRQADGSPLPIHLTASQLPLPDQSVICLVVSDLTEQRKHAELRLAKELAEKANLAKDAFMAALSHELRTPLTPVLVTATALEQNPSLPEDVRESLAVIRRNVELEARLIDDLLDLTRISHGKMTLHSNEFDFHTLINRAVEICRSESHSKSQDIILKLDAQSRVGRGDVVRLQQAMWNLIRNAVKFTGRKGKIVIRTSNPAPDKFLFEVADNGIGFEPKSADKLFQAFEQGGRQVTKQFGGLGLGLAISKSIIEAHKGTIRAVSKGDGKGATFAFELPLQSKATLSTQKAASPAAMPDFVKKRILLVEDHKDTRNSLEFLLKRNLHDVKSAGTATEALELATLHTFDLVVSDIGLPDQSGLQLMRVLKERFKLKGIGLSGYGMEDDLTKSEAAGFDCYLTKPVRFEQLKQAISDIG